MACRSMLVRGINDLPLTRHPKVFCPDIVAGGSFSRSVGSVSFENTEHEDSIFKAEKRNIIISVLNVCRVDMTTIVSYPIFIRI